jgi:hypothetical protein
MPPASRAQQLGEGHLQILVDTPASQVVEVEAEGSGSLGARASLIANLMVAGELKEAIARAANVSPQQLIAISDAAVGPTSGPPPQLNDPRAYILKTSVVSNQDGLQLPIIAVDTQAPDAAHAAAVANAAAAGLKQYLDARAMRTGVPDGKRLQVRSLGVAQARDVLRGPGLFLAVVAAMFFFGLLCGTLLLLVAFQRGWRAAGSRDEDAPVQSFHDSHSDPLEPREPAPVVPIGSAAAAIPPPPSPGGGWADAPVRAVPKKA